MAPSDVIKVLHYLGYSVRKMRCFYGEIGKTAYAARGDAATT